MGGGGNGADGLIGIAGCVDGADGITGVAGPDAGTYFGAIAGADGGEAFAGAVLMRTAESGSPLGPKMPLTSSGTSTVFCVVRRGNWSGLSWATISGNGNSIGV
jgi:hypothetical protein